MPASFSCTTGTYELAKALSSPHAPKNMLRLWVLDFGVSFLFLGGGVRQKARGRRTTTLKRRRRLRQRNPRMAGLDACYFNPARFSRNGVMGENLSARLSRPVSCQISSQAPVRSTRRSHCRQRSPVTQIPNAAGLAQPAVDHTRAALAPPTAHAFRQAAGTASELCGGSFSR